MRWIAFFFGMIVLLIAQSAIAPALEILGVRPDWLCVCVVFLAMFVQPRDALIGAWLIGLLGDLMTIERLGLLALTYALVALCVLAVRDFLFCHKGATQFVVTFVAALAVQASWLAYRRLLYGGIDPLAGQIVWQVALPALYTAIWAPLLHRLMLSGGRWLGVARPKYSHAGLSRALR